MRYINIEDSSLSSVLLVNSAYVKIEIDVLNFVVRYFGIILICVVCDGYPCSRQVKVVASLVKFRLVLEWALQYEFDCFAMTFLQSNVETHIVCTYRYLILSEAFRNRRQRDPSVHIIKTRGKGPGSYRLDRRYILGQWFAHLSARFSGRIVLLS